MHRPGATLLGYSVTEPTVGCCSCSTLSDAGWLAVIILAVVFWPAACVPCCIGASYGAGKQLSVLMLTASSCVRAEELHHPVQRPVYGTAPPVAVGVPAAARPGKVV